MAKIDHQLKVLLVYLCLSECVVVYLLKLKTIHKATTMETKRHYSFSFLHNTVPYTCSGWRLPQSGCNVNRIWCRMCCLWFLVLRTYGSLHAEWTSWGVIISPQFCGFYLQSLWLCHWNVKVIPHRLAYGPNFVELIKNRLESISVTVYDVHAAIY